MLKNNNFRKMLILTNCMTEFREYQSVYGSADSVATEVHIPKHTRSLSGSLLGYKTIP